jgi:hypothetical protein
MIRNPALTHALARERALELRQIAPVRGRGKRRPARHRIVGAARRGTGWLLVDIGLRLAVPPPSMSPPMARRR